MRSWRRLALTPLLGLALAQPGPAWAGWKLIPARQPVALADMTVTPQSDWNQANARPGERAEAWTHDGFGLNGLELFAGVADGQPLYRERNAKQNPMPKFTAGLLLPELADFFERSFRAQNRLSDFTVVESGPVTFGGHRGLRVRYRYALPNDELVREGEARMAVVGGKLYVANYYAPQVHYFPDGLSEAKVIMDGARF
jgi:hypothetical protein